MKPKLSIVIPVFNEVKTVGQLLDLVWNLELESVDKEIIIVESNSSDGSREIVQKFTQIKKPSPHHSVQLLLQERAEGKGKAVREGLEAATGDIILIQDADLEYDVNDYGALVAPLLSHQTDFVLGSRHLSSGSWKIRSFGKNQIRSRFMNVGGLLFHTLFNLVFGVKLSDPTTMYKVFRRSCLENFDLVSNRFDFDFELLGKLIRSGYHPLEIPVSYSSRGFEDGKKIQIFRDPWTWVVAIFKFRFCPISKPIRKEKAQSSPI